MGSAVQNVFTSAKVLALAAVVLVGLVAKNATALAANFLEPRRWRGVA